MEAKNLINQNTELVPSDILKNRKGKLYKIQTYHNDKNTFKVCPWPASRGEENPSYIIISREGLMAKEWEKVDSEELKALPGPELQLSESSIEEEIDSLFIKEERPSKEESVDF